MILTLKNFSVNAFCKFQSKAYTSCTPDFSYTFKPGAYALVGQIDHGGWAVSYALAPIDKKDIYIHKSEDEDRLMFYVDNQEVSLDYLRTLSHHLGFYTLKKSAAYNKSAKKQLAKAIKSGTSQYTLNELKEMFGLTEERFKRPLHMTGNEAWRITAAVGLAAGKKIFCFPWLTNNYLKPLTYAIEKMAEIIRQDNGILLLPVENADLVKGFVDDIIDLSQPKIV